ncbi:MAG: S8 family serine peptidase [Gemmatimonadetes bacterium]|nr:S8 family serine peptidase [Gemmatimonadota bacterium]
MRIRVPLLLTFFALLLGACTDYRQDPLQPPLDALASKAGAPEPIPPRGEDLAGYWELMTDEELWQHLQAQDGQAVIGIKNPGEARGIWRNRVLVSAATLRGAEVVLRARSDVEVLQAYERPPFIVLRIESPDALSAIRALPFRDYLQPLYMDTGSGSGMMDGCGWSETYTGGAPLSSWGDPIPPGLARMGIRDAWRRNAGENAVIGVTDTGVSLDQANLRANFATGASANGRWHEIITVVSGGTQDYCGHGTRLAGLSFAPKNGSSMVGAAWKANAVSVRQGDGVSTSGGLNSAFVTAAINTAVSATPNPNFDHHRRIVSMAWGAASSHSNVEDAIRDNHGRGALFFGASGTSGWFTWSGVVFPATMREVVAVSAVNPDGSRVSNVHYGSQVELAAYVDQLGTGQFTTQIRTVAGSSAATAAMSGIAALVWTQYPNLTNEQVRRRLQWAGHIHPSRNDTHGYGIVNAFKAVGGMHAVRIDAPFWVDPYSSFTVTAEPLGGTGPFSYQWSNGATTRSTTYTAGGEWSTVDYSVRVTDAFDGATRTGAGTSYAQDRSGCEDESMIVC